MCIIRRILAFLVVMLFVPSIAMANHQHTGSSSLSAVVSSVPSGVSATASSTSSVQYAVGTPMLNNLSYLYDTNFNLLMTSHKATHLKTLTNTFSYGITSAGNHSFYMYTDHYCIAADCGWNHATTAWAWLPDHSFEYGSTLSRTMYTSNYGINFSAYTYSNLNTSTGISVRAYLYQDGVLVADRWNWRAGNGTINVSDAYYSNRAPVQYMLSTEHGVHGNRYFLTKYENVPIIDWP